MILYLTSIIVELWNECCFHRNCHYAKLECVPRFHNSSTKTSQLPLQKSETPFSLRIIVFHPSFFVSFSYKAIIIRSSFCLSHNFFDNSLLNVGKNNATCVRVFNCTVPLKLHLRRRSKIFVPSYSEGKRVNGYGKRCQVSFFECVLPTSV